jgi:hypothetical protein
MFQRNVLPTSSELKSKPSKKPARSSLSHLGLLFDPEGKDGIVLQNIDEHLLDYMMLYPRR